MSVGIEVYRTLIEGKLYTIVIAVSSDSLTISNNNNLLCMIKELFAKDEFRTTKPA